MSCVCFDFRIVGIGVLTAVVFTIFYQVAEILSFFIEGWSVFGSALAVIIFLLIFLSTVMISALKKFTPKEGVIYGGMIGLVGGLITFIISLVFTLLSYYFMDPGIISQILSIELVLHVLIPQTIFLILIGIIGTQIPQLYNKYNL